MQAHIKLESELFKFKSLNFEAVFGGIMKNIIKLVVMATVINLCACSQGFKIETYRIDSMRQESVQIEKPWYCSYVTCQKVEATEVHGS